MAENLSRKRTYATFVLHIFNETFNSNNSVSILFDDRTYILGRGYGLRVRVPA
jgi:hypothetical protein